VEEILETISAYMCNFFKFLCEDVEKDEEEDVDEGDDDKGNDDCDWMLAYRIQSI
jgi:hypothetical protein